MWQRAQTVYLALIVIVLSLTLVFPFATFPLGDANVEFNLFGLAKNTKEVTTWFPFYITIALAIGLSLFSLIQFKNRKRQLKLGTVNYLLIILTLVMVFWDTYTISGNMGIKEADVSNGIGLFLVVAALPLNLLANRSIKADEKLVKSMDRLR
jgi:hypothetical protein